jgi:hypothetical protein
MTFTRSTQSQKTGGPNKCKSLERNVPNQDSQLAYARMRFTGVLIINYMFLGTEKNSVIDTSNNSYCIAIKGNKGNN